MIIYRYLVQAAKDRKCVRMVTIEPYDKRKEAIEEKASVCYILTRMFVPQASEVNGIRIFNSSQAIEV